MGNYAAKWILMVEITIHAEMCVSLNLVRQSYSSVGAGNLRFFDTLVRIPAVNC